MAFIRINKFFAMDFKKTIIAVVMCGMAVLAASAQSSFKLPKQHTTIAEGMMQANFTKGSPFAEVSMKEVCTRSPFADMYTASEAVSKAHDVFVPGNGTASKMVNYAKRFLGTRYVLGATGPSAFDCSGFVGYVYRNFGINLNRTSRDQYRQGEKVNMSNIRPGDLLFFSCRSSGPGNVGHVAMVVSVDKASGTCQFIHASVKKGVTYQKFPDNGYYSRNFIGARRILGTSLDNSSKVMADR